MLMYKSSSASCVQNPPDCHHCKLLSSVFFSTLVTLSLQPLLSAATVRVSPSTLDNGRAIAQNGGLLGALGTWAEVLTDLAGLSVA